MNPASMSFAFCSPCTLFRQSAISSADSQSQSIHAPLTLLFCCPLPRGWKRKQPLHCVNSASNSMPSATSVSDAMHDLHMFIAFEA
uniref:Uncharacterized protein n=1 Tax=Globisporangium ultimum (strain ATCC 200006 / CBS 805.95 / DAOM BR144) TaxID=431595 RepID=K3WWT7_GLOUD